jgi:ketosteroid isomerase-like protein
MSGAEIMSNAESRSVENETVENKRIIQQVFDALAEGRTQAMLDHLAEDISFVVMGTGSWSRSYDGKAAVLAELFAPLRAKLAGQIILTPLRLTAEGDHVVVQAKGRNTTVDGKAYGNTYCNVIRLERGLIREWIEYCDTLLIETALGPPPAASAR